MEVKALMVVCTLMAIVVATNAQRNFGNNNFNQQRPFNGNNNNRFVPQNNNRINNNNRFVQPNNNAFAAQAAPVFRATPANAVDGSGNEVYPGCNGTVCLPEAQQCSIRKQKSGHFTFNNQNYWISFASSDPLLRNARWNWFTGRNYCRKMCMDMVSLETQQEENFIHNLMKASGISDVHTSGRLCDGEVEGCDQPRFQPIQINGWFWASTLQMMPPTNQVSGPAYNNWSPTGPTGQRQPDGTLKADGWGNEACMALLDNKFNDGLRWHDEPCNNRRVVICEDLPAPNINFVRNNNPGIFIP